MSDEKEQQKEKGHEGENAKPPATGQQEQSDPQLTELRGFTDPSEDLEPTLTDGNKSPDNAVQDDKEE